ncbi:MAG TPA: YdeI/OmpD-associated family protein [Phycisphaerales bacterium]|nr:YdeI/OmpD-associated family protein [Phycisphaerales bacterium]
MARTPTKAAPTTIRFSATLLRPKAARGKTVAGGWSFLMLPKEASSKLRSRGQVSVEGTMNGAAFRATLEPDGQGGHWLKVDRKLREVSGAEVGEIVTLEIAPLPPEREPEPDVPTDLRKALASATQRAREVWADITPVARRDWIQWIITAKQAETRARRINTACDMLAKGKRRPCCFDRSGMYAKSLSCPIAEDD